MQKNFRHLFLPSLILLSLDPLSNSHEALEERQRQAMARYASPKEKNREKKGGEGFIHSYRRMKKGLAC